LVTSPLSNRPKSLLVGGLKFQSFGGYEKKNTGLALLEQSSLVKAKPPPTLAIGPFLSIKWQFDDD